MQENLEQALSVDGLGFGYTKANVWEDVSFSLEKGQVAFLTGENGSGKSTLLRCLAGWSTPRSGSIELCGQPFKGYDRTQRAQICFVPDAPSFYEDLTALEHIQFVHMANHRQDRLERAERLMREFGLSAFADQYPSSYSRGMREKLGLVIALSLEPAVLLLDEPYGPLDRASSKLLSRELTAALTRGMAIIVSCHHDVPELVPDILLQLHEGILQCGRSGATAHESVEHALSREDPLSEDTVYNDVL